MERRIETMEALALRPAQAARMLNVSPKTLWTWTRRNMIPHVKIGSDRRPIILYPIAELRKWLSERAAGDAATRQADGPSP